MTEQDLKAALSEAYEKGGNADTVVACPECGGVLAGSVGYLWCTTCGKAKS